MRRFRGHRWWFLTLVLTVPVIALAAVPNVFTANTVISSAQVNANFAAQDTELAAVKADLAALKASLKPTWTNAELINSWVSYAGSYNTPSFTKDAQGFVHLRGLVKRGDGQTALTAFILPAGFRPAAFLEVPVACSGNVPCEMIVKTNGEAYFETGDPGWVSLDGVTFESP